MAEDIDKLVDWAKSQGWDVRISVNGYRHFHSPDGEHIGYYPATRAALPGGSPGS